MDWVYWTFCLHTLLHCTGSPASLLPFYQPRHSRLGHSSIGPAFSGLDGTCLPLVCVLCHGACIILHWLQVVTCYLAQALLVVLLWCVARLLRAILLSFCAPARTYPINYYLFCHLVLPPPPPPLLGRWLGGWEDLLGRGAITAFPTPAFHHFSICYHRHILEHHLPHTGGKRVALREDLFRCGCLVVAVAVRAPPLYHHLFSYACHST